MPSLLPQLKASPWAITREYMDAMLSMAERGSEELEALATKRGELDDVANNTVVRDGVATIKINGPLMKRGGFFSWLMGRATYESLAIDFTAAVEDPSISAIVLDIDSPGGMVSGCGELCDIIYEARGSKPVVAYSNGVIASAAYWIASAADEIVLNDSAEAGSVGAVMTITDFSKMDEELGIKVWEIVSTQSPYKRLDPAKDDHMARLQARVDKFAGVFIENVARNRGITAEDVQQNYGQGDMLVGRDAVEAGLVDRLGSFEGLMAELSRRDDEPGIFSAAAGGQTNGAESMILYLTSKAPTAGEDQRKNEATAANVAAMLPEIAEELRAEGREAAQAEASTAATDASAEAVTAERERIQAILGSEHAEGREDLAAHLAFGTDMDAEAAAAMLDKAPKAAPAPAANIDPLAAAMANEENPDVGADTSTGEDTEAAAAARSAELGKQFNIE